MATVRRKRNTLRTILFSRIPVLLLFCILHFPTTVDMYSISILFPFLLPSILANPLTLTQPLSPNLTSLLLAPAYPLTTDLTTSALTTDIGCFKQTKVPPWITTNKNDCEAALDDWVRGESLTQPREFSRIPSTIDDVVLPLQKESGSCMIYASMLDEHDEDVLTLAEVYAELLGPMGVMKQCLGQVRMPAIGGRMTLGPKGLLKVVVTGRQVGGSEG